MIKLFTVSEMIAAEKAAAAAGHSYDAMMEAAGRGVAEAIITHQPQERVEGKAILILVGPGNNGGDALVAARYLHWAGAKVVCYLLKKIEPKENPNYQKAIAEEIPILTAVDDQRFRVLRRRLTGVDIVVDGLLGTGVSRPIENGSTLARLLRQVAAGLEERARLEAEEINQARREAGFEIPLFQIRPVEPAVNKWRPQVVAVDCPSGLNCDTGEIDPLALPADLTVTFAGPKRGHFLFPGAAACGEIVVADIGIDERHVQNVPMSLATSAAAAGMVPARPADGHKGTFGRVLIAAGSDRYRGAPFLTARAALRGGSGLVTLAVPQTLQTGGMARLPEVTFAAVGENDALTAADAHALIPDLPSYDAVVVGPGLSTAAAGFVDTLLPHLTQPVVLDADALNILAENERWPAGLPSQAICTPHPGEMARLCGMPLPDLLALDRFELALEKAAAWNCVLVLKGAYTVVALPEGRGWVIPFANPLLAAAGSGDVLAGLIASIAGQGATPDKAAISGAFLHGLAAQHAQKTFGTAGLLAHELADKIPLARSSLGVR